MCDVIELGKLGKSRAQIAAKLGICKHTLQQWEPQHDDFSATMSNSFAQAWWEDLGQDGVSQGKEFNTTAFITFPEPEEGEKADKINEQVSSRPWELWKKKAMAK
jgi:hypothetical protein